MHLCVCSSVLCVEVCIQSLLHAGHVLHCWLVSLVPSVLGLMSKSMRTGESSMTVRTVLLCVGVWGKQYLRIMIVLRDYFEIGV